MATTTRTISAIQKSSIITPPKIVHPAPKPCSQNIGVPPVTHHAARCSRCTERWGISAAPATINMATKAARYIAGQAARHPARDRANTGHAPESRPAQDCPQSANPGQEARRMPTQLVHERGVAGQPLAAEPAEELLCAVTD